MKDSCEQVTGGPAGNNRRHPQKKRRFGRVVYPAIFLLLLAILMVPQLTDLLGEAPEVMSLEEITQ